MKKCVIIAEIIWLLLCGLVSGTSIWCGYSIDSVPWWIFCGSVWITYCCGKIVGHMEK